MIDTNFLKHYGVKGMHWGVRHFQPYKSHNKNSNRRFSYDDDIVVPKGMEAYRITTKNFDSKKKTGTYLTVDENDRNFYKGTWGTELKSLDKNGKIYENTYKIKEDLISPSANKRQTIAANLARDPEIQHEIAKGVFYNKLVKNGLDSGKAHMYQDYWESVKDPEYLKALSSFESSIFKTKDITKDDVAAGLFFGALGANDNLKVIYGKK